MKSLCSSVCPLIGRILLSAIFIMSGGGKIFSWSATVEQMEGQGMPMAPLLLIGAIVLELLGGLFVLFGFRARIGSAMLIVFLIPTTLIFHDFWSFTGDERQMQMINFMKNLAILGGLFYVLAYGSGSISCDSKLSRKKLDQPDS